MNLIFIGVYAHTAYRHWESDSDVLDSHLNPKVCVDIATQLILGKTGQNLHVILGGGRKKFIPKYSSDEEGRPGDRSDEINLISEWIGQKAEMGVKSEYVSNRSQLLKVKNDTEYLLGKKTNILGENFFMDCTQGISRRKGHNLNISLINKSKIT